MLKIRLSSELGFSQDLPLHSKSLTLSTYLNFMEIDSSQDPLEQVIVNSREYEINQESNQNIITCYFELDQTCTVHIKSRAQSLRYTFIYAESLRVEKQSIEVLADFHRRTVDWLGEGPSSLDRIINGIQEGQIPLLHILDPLTGIDDLSVLEYIEAALPFALNICTKPRQHLRVEDEILDVELVKRISPAALQHLSSHSEHWRARTITGLIPSRLRAEVYEDDINLYENIFFRMVIQKTIALVAQKDIDIKKALAQKNSLIDWDRYGQVVNDYKRSEFLYKLLPKYDFEMESIMKEELEELRSRLKRLERILTTVVSTPFYQGIDRNRRLELPIQPTNIIKMDPRYHEMFKLWNRLQELEMKQKTEDITHAAVVNPNHYYEVYVQILLVYSLHLMGYPFTSNSEVYVSEGGSIRLVILLTTDWFEISVQSAMNRGHSGALDIQITEVLAYESKVPATCDTNHIAMELQEYGNICELMNPGIILFKKKPTPEVERLLHNLFKKVRDENPQQSKELKYKIDNMDKTWRKWLSEEFQHIKLPRSFKLRIQPVLGSIGSDESDLKRNTVTILDGGLHYLSSSEADCSIFVLPMELSKYGEVKNEAYIRRLINYGESYTPQDAKLWGSYRIGILPVSQTEIQSAPRLIKLISLHTSKLCIEWGKSENNCPVCGTEQIEQIDKTSWRCKSDDCSVLWGTTRCSDGCGLHYPWIKPYVDPKSFDRSTDGPLEKLLWKENLFGRLTITDFDWKKESDSETGKFVLSCPKCGSV